MNRNANIVERNIHDTYYLIDITQNVLEDKCCLYEINQVGDFIWNRIEKTSDLSIIVDALIKEIVDEVDYSEVYSDVKEFADQLISMGFLEE